MNYYFHFFFPGWTHIRYKEKQKKKIRSSMIYNNLALKVFKHIPTCEIKHNYLLFFFKKI